MSVNILAIDPGKDKTGLAVLSPDKTPLIKCVIPTLELSEKVMELALEHKVGIIILGSGTWGKAVEKQLLKLPMKANIIFACEKFTTLQARKRYFAEHPLRGWRKLLPLTLQDPPEPYDDYVAVILGERYLEGKG
jgi:RNase H-fold protein (predicted Holliday junction resolvase)